MAYCPCPAHQEWRKMNQRVKQRTFGALYGMSVAREVVLDAIKDRQSARAAEPQHGLLKDLDPLGELNIPPYAPDLPESWSSR